MKRFRIGLAIFVMILMLGGSANQSWARSVISGGGKCVFRGADSEKVGVATFVNIGTELNPGIYPRIITWVQYDAEKSNGTVDVDNVTANVTYLTEQLVKPIRMGGFFTVGGGGGKVEGKAVAVSVLGNIGVYFDFTDKTQLQIGIGASNTGNYTTYGFKLGLALYH